LFWAFPYRKNKTNREVSVIPRTESDESVSLKGNEPEVKSGLEADGTNLTELSQECFVPVLDKNEDVVSNDI
jgi:hypothetical protein